MSQEKDPYERCNPFFKVDGLEIYRAHANTKGDYALDHISMANPKDKDFIDVEALHTEGKISLDEKTVWNKLREAYAEGFYQYLKLNAIIANDFDKKNETSNFRSL